MASHVIEKARAATTELRDAARLGRVIDFRQRDPLVMAIHDALDALEWQPIATAQKEDQQPLLLWTPHMAAVGYWDGDD